LVEQHSAPAPQDSPSVLQLPVPGVAAHVKLVHTVEQHSVPDAHAVPTDLQAVGLQAPPAQLPEQHSRLEVQEPVTLQNELAQALLMQLPEQHCAPLVQAP
jgi:hypothetical protein